jgi:hypothetical protein
MLSTIATIVLLIVIPALLLMGGCGSSPEENGNGNGDVPTVDWAADGAITSGEYAKTATFGNYVLSWRSDTQNIYIGMRVKTVGWVALGIKPTSAMKDADIVLGYVADGQTTITDQYGTSAYVHQLDTGLGGTDDIIAFAGSDDGEYTVLEFSRTLAADDEYDKPITSGANPIIWSYGSADNGSSQHAARGSGTLNL